MIYDLTQGKYSMFFDSVKTYDKHLQEELRRVFAPYLSKFLFLHTKKSSCKGASMEYLFNTTPIFLVDTSMINKHVSVDEGGFRIQVPEDKQDSLEDDEDFDINGWVRAKEYNKREFPQMIIYDLFGVYIQDDIIVQKKIFIWLDKIEAYAKNHSQKKENISDNAKALLDLVLYHELGHALMDVELYGEPPSALFSYKNDYIYRFIEEAYANCIALTCLFRRVIEEERHRDDDRYRHGIHIPSLEERCQATPKGSFIIDFVLNQGKGYSNGWDLFKRYSHFLYGIDQWMCVKILFNYELACCLRNFWIDKNFNKLNYVKEVGRDCWFLLKDQNDQYMVMDIITRKWVSQFNRYDYFWYFEEGVSIVKENDLWGCVDEEGKEVVPCIYEWIFGFEKGVSMVQNKKDMYGAIDKHNNIIIPIKYSREQVEFELKLYRNKLDI